MITGNHHGHDARVARLGDGFAHVGPQRVDHADEAGAGEFGRRWRCISCAEIRRCRAIGDGEDPVAVFCHLPRHRQQALRILPFGQHLENPLGRAFYMHAHTVVMAVERGRELPLRLEGDVVQLRMEFLGVFLAPAELISHRQQRHVRRIAVPGPAAVAAQQLTFVAQSGRAREVCQCHRFVRFDRYAVLQEAPLRFEALPGHFVDAAVRRAYLLHRQLVAGERAGLVARDERAGAEALDGREPPHDDAAPRHARGADGQRHRQCDRQALGDRRHGERHAEHEHFRDGIATHHDAHHRDACGGDQHDHRDAARERLHALHERRTTAFGADDVQREAADGAVRACCDHRPVAAAARDHRTRVQHIQAIRERGPLTAGPVGLLRYGERFTGEQGLVDLESVRRDQADVGRHAVAGLEVDDVAGHERLRIDVEHPVAAANGRADAQQLLQRLAGFLGTCLLHGSYDGVDKEHAHDKRGILHLADHQRHAGRDAEQVDQGAPELPQDDFEETGWLPPRQGIGPETRQPRSRFLVAETTGRGTQRIQYGRKVHRVPIAAACSWRGIIRAVAP